MTNDTAATDTFPVDWSAWRDQWTAWREEQLTAGTLTRSSYRFEGKNFLADEILGVYRVPATDRTVELSEVTFMNMRGVGVTYSTGAGTESGGVVHPFAELEREVFGEEPCPRCGATARTRFCPELCEAGR